MKRYNASLGSKKTKKLPIADKTDISQARTSAITKRIDYVISLNFQIA